MGLEALIRIGYAIPSFFQFQINTNGNEAFFHYQNFDIGEISGGNLKERKFGHKISSLKITALNNLNYEFIAFLTLLLNSFYISNSE